MHRIVKALNRFAYTLFGIACTKSIIGAWYIDPNSIKIFIFIGIPALWSAALTEAKEDSIFGLPMAKDNRACIQFLGESSDDYN